MALVELVIIMFVSNRVFAEDEGLPDGVQYLTPQELAELSLWNSDSEQNIWELSGQFEGDMVFTQDQRNGAVNSQYRWPKAELPYEIDQIAFDKTSRKLIEDALAIIADVSCVKPRRRRFTDVDYVYVTNKGAGCWSYVGKIGKKQNLNLDKGCLRTGTIIHEFLHALGFHHQQSDSKRDDYVTIFLTNVKPGNEANFNKYPSNIVTSFEEPYDYNSIMHYGRKAFSANGKDTIVPKNPKADIGNREQLSAIDIKKINKMYNCQ